MGNVIGEIVTAHIAKQNEAIEEACERMLLSPTKSGVLVETFKDGLQWRVSLTTEYEPMCISYVHA